MRQQRFSFEFSEAMFQIQEGGKNKWQNLTLTVYANAHIASDGSAHHSDIYSLSHDGCEFLPNLIWLCNRELFERIEQATDHHAEELFTEKSTA